MLTPSLAAWVVHVDAGGVYFLLVGCPGKGEGCAQRTFSEWQPTPVFLPGEAPRTEEPGGATVHGAAESQTRLEQGSSQGSISAWGFGEAEGRRRGRGSPARSGQAQDARSADLRFCFARIQGFVSGFMQRHGNGPRLPGDVLPRCPASPVGCRYATLLPVWVSSQKSITRPRTSPSSTTCPIT